MKFSINDKVKHYLHGNGFVTAIVSGGRIIDVNFGSKSIYVQETSLKNLTKPKLKLPRPTGRIRKRKSFKNVYRSRNPFAQARVTEGYAYRL